MKLIRFTKGQVRLAESMAVLIIFFFMLFFGYAVYSQFQHESLQRSLEENEQNTAVKIAQRAYFLPEVQCSQGFGNTDSSCIDLGKALAMEQYLFDNENIKQNFYFDLLGISRIEYYQVYPEITESFFTQLRTDNVGNFQNPYDLTPYDYDPTDEFSIPIPTIILYQQDDLAEAVGREGAQPIQMPVALYDPTQKDTYFGYLQVVYHSAVI